VEKRFCTSRKARSPLHLVLQGIKLFPIGGQYQNCAGKSSHPCSRFVEQCGHESLGGFGTEREFRRKDHKNVVIPLLRHFFRRFRPNLASQDGRLVPHPFFQCFFNLIADSLVAYGFLRFGNRPV